MQVDIGGVVRTYEMTRMVRPHVFRADTRSKHVPGGEILPDGITIPHHSQMGHLKALRRCDDVLRSIEAEYGVLTPGGYGN